MYIWWLFLDGQSVAVVGHTFLCHFEHCYTGTKPNVRIMSTRRQHLLSVLQPRSFDRRRGKLPPVPNISQGGVSADIHYHCASQALIVAGDTWADCFSICMSCSHTPCGEPQNARRTESCTKSCSLSRRTTAARTVLISTSCAKGTTFQSVARGISAQMWISEGDRSWSRSNQQLTSAPREVSIMLSSGHPDKRAWIYIVSILTWKLYCRYTDRGSVRGIN